MKYFARKKFLKLKNSRKLKTISTDHNIKICFIQLTLTDFNFIHYKEKEMEIHFFSRKSYISTY